MDAIIAKILEIDAKAKAILQETENNILHSEEIIASETEALNAEIKVAYIEKANAVRQNMMAKAQHEARAHRDFSVEQILQMEHLAEVYSAQWVEELFQRITERS